MAKKSKLPINEALGVVAGAVAAGFVTKLVNDKLTMIPAPVRAVIPVGLGIFLAGNKKTIIKGIGFGMIAKGGSDLAKALLPGTIGALDQDIFVSGPADLSVLSGPASLDVLSGADDVQFISEDMISEDMISEDMISEDMISEDMISEDFISGDEAVIFGLNEE
jgi:hypothetical protein